ncbi:MAG: arginine deiminase-related protein [Planctomycetota bacterium]
MQLVPPPQTTSTVLMVRPARFGPNPATAGSNVFQRGADGAEASALVDRARAEFDGFAQALEDASVTTLVLDDAPSGGSTDAVFPNNCVSFHADGSAVLYPMEVESRRGEVGADAIDEIERRTGALWPRRLDLAPLADEGAFLEGTGSLVLDRPRRIAYACRSSRTTPSGCEAFEREMAYEVFAFGATAKGKPIYHTNVLLSLGPRFAVACLDAIDDVDERAELIERLQESGRDLIAITLDELHAFCGNVLALESAKGDAVIAMSERARSAFRPAHRARLEEHGSLVAADLTTIETYGGGSARCMLAEVFLPSR